MAKSSFRYAFCFGGRTPADVAVDEGLAVLIASFPQALEDLLRAQVMRFEPADDLSLVGIELTAARSVRALRVAFPP